jgi:hypothetical protein
MIKKISAILIFLLLVASVNAKDTTIILDAADKTTTFSGNAYVIASLAVAIFAILIIVKIFLMMRRGD